MSTWAIGDVQGCHDELVELLQRIDFRPGRDRLWFTGDLVNRGPRSADTLRLVRSLGDSAVVVLGNHDLFLLAIAAGHGRIHAGDTMQEVLAAKDRDALLDWLARQHLAHHEDGFLLVHAGVLPQWSAARTAELAREVEHAIVHDPGLFAVMRGNRPDAWDDALAGHDRLRVLINAMTRMRFITREGRMEFATKTDQPPPGYLAWDEVQSRKSADSHIIFGHWASRGLVQKPGISGLDSGCVWGRQLSAMRLSDRRIVQIECHAGPRGYSDVAP